MWPLSATPSPRAGGGSESWEKHWGKYLERDDTISKEVMHDFLHLAPKGYDIWAEAIAGKVEEIVSAPLRRK